MTTEQQPIQQSAPSTDPLDYVPPNEEIPESSFGQYVPDGMHDVKVVGYQIQDNGMNAWVRCVITKGQYVNRGEHSMNLFMPTREALNQKAREKGSKEEALKAFFHWKQTLKTCGIPLNTSLKGALSALVGWEGRAVFENRAGYNTTIKELVALEASPIPSAPPVAAATNGAKDTPF